MATSIKQQQLPFPAAGVKKMRLMYVFEFLSVFTVDSVDIIYKEGTDRTLLGHI
jgi:hypothetical protein